MAIVKGLTRFPRTYNLTDFGITADVVCQNAQWTTIGEIVVPAQQQVTFGVGDTLGGVDTREIAYIQLEDTSAADLAGKYRLVLTDANETKTLVVVEQRTERFSASATDRTVGFLVGEYPINAKEDSKLQMRFYPDGGAAITIDFDATDNVILIPVTTYQ